MPDGLYFFRAPGGAVAAALPLDLEALIAEWASLRPRMARELPAAFSRDEWAYLMDFLAPANLRRPFADAFGEPIDPPATAPSRLFRPRGPVALWLPNNVSLLGPLTLVLLSLTGQPVRIKGGSHSENLTAELLAFAARHLPDGVLSRYLARQVRCEVFDRADPRNAEMAATARVRIIFGSDATAAAIEALPHPLESIGFAFVDRRSEAWVQESVLTDALLIMLLRVFAIYGQAGCTSPTRVVLLDGDAASARRLRDRLLELWPATFRQDPPMHVASASLMARQWAAALGWEARCTARNGAVIASGSLDLAPCSAPRLLAVVPATADEAVAALPANIQTIGHALEDPGAPHWLERLAATGVKRFVPLARMHHFGPVWDGWELWRQLFGAMEIQT